MEWFANFAPAIGPLLKTFETDFSKKLEWIGLVFTRELVHPVRIGPAISYQMGGVVL